MSEILITVLGGWFGLHKFVKGKTKVGLLYLVTLGVFGIGWIADIIIAINKCSKSKEISVVEFNVVGTHYYRNEIISLLKKNTSGRSKFLYYTLEDYAVLALEPNNPHDPNAIKVLMRGVQVGYVPSDMTFSIKPLLNKCKFVGYICGGDIFDGEYKEKRDFSIIVRIEDK